MAHQDPHTQRLAMPMAKKSTLSSTTLAVVAHLSLQAAHNRLHSYVEKGLIEACGGKGVRHDPVRYHITAIGLAWLEPGRVPVPPAFDFVAMLGKWGRAA